MPLFAPKQPLRQAASQQRASNDEAMQKNYVEYGRRLEKVIGEIKSVPNRS